MTQTSRRAYLAELHRGVLDKRHPLDRAETIIGRDVEAHIRIDDGSVSRQHAAIQRRGERFVICDLGSRNGTNVNEQHLRAGAERELKVNDCIFLGKAVLCFVEAEERMSLSGDVELDPLTNTPNRRGFRTRLAQQMAEARAEHRPLALFLIGIDDMAGYNQRFGQEAGDFIIKHVSGVLQKSLEPREVLGRFRGAVFGVIAPDLLDGLLVDRAQALRSRIEEQPAQLGDELALIGVSIGVTPMMALDQEKILEAADAALSHAKQRGSSVERAMRSPDAQTERYRRRLVPETLFAQWLHPPAFAVVIKLPGQKQKLARQTPLDFELQSTLQQNLSGDELATYPEGGGWVVFTVPRADESRVPRLCDAIRSAFELALVNRKSPPVALEFSLPTLVESAQAAIALAQR